MKQLFFNSQEQRIRAGWRFVLQIAIMLVVVALPIYLLSETATTLFKTGRIPLSKELYDKLMNMVVGMLLCVLVLFSLRVSGRWLDRRPFQEYGFHITPRWWQQYAMGLLLGVFLIAIVFTVEYFLGMVTVTGFFHTSTAAIPAMIAFAYPVIKSLCVGVYEEAISRGYQIPNFKEGFTGVWGLSEKQASVLAVLMSSAIFGILHIFNDNASAMSSFVIFIGGAMLGTAYIVTGELGMAIGLHTAWNLSEGWLFGFNVSGDPESSSLITIYQSGADWLTGGNFGPEGGMLGLVVSVVGIGLIVAWNRWQMNRY